MDILLDTLKRSLKRQQTLFCMRAYGPTAYLLSEHIGLPTTTNKVRNIH